MEIEPLDATFGAIVRGIELADLDDATWAELHATWLEYALLIFPGQFLTRDEQNDFARRFGDLEFEAAPISEHRQDGNGPLRARRRRREVAATATRAGTTTAPTCPCRRRARCSPPRSCPTTARATGWADMRAAYEALDDADPSASSSRCRRTTRCTTARVGPGTCRRRQNEQGGYNQYGYHDGEPSLRPLVKVHPDTGRPNLLHRPPRLRHRRHGSRRVRALPRRAQRMGLPAAAHLLTTSGRSVTR